MGYNIAPDNEKAIILLCVIHFFIAQSENCILVWIVLSFSSAGIVVVLKQYGHSHVEDQ
jgi:multisubunit Na+/H+ antiporter MnhC subunit